MPRKKDTDKSFPIAPVLPAIVAVPQLDTAVALRRPQETFVNLARSFYELVELAKQGHGRNNHPTPQPWVVADRLDQEALCSIQTRFAEILRKFAFILGPQFEKSLVIELPYLFSSSESRAK